MDNNLKHDLEILRSFLKMKYKHDADYIIHEIDRIMETGNSKDLKKISDLFLLVRDFDDKKSG